MASKPKVGKDLAVTVDTRKGIRFTLEVEAHPCQDQPRAATANASTVSTRIAGSTLESAKNADSLDRFFRAQQHRIDAVRQWKVFGGRHTSSACVDEGEEN